MPRIFRWEEIPDRVPIISSFEFVGHLLHERLTHDPAIMAAVIFGSLPQGTVMRTSNIDVLAIYDERLESGQPWIFRSLTQQAAKLNVPIDWHIVDINSALLGTHGIDYSLRQHLQQVQKSIWVIKDDPLPLLSFKLGNKSREAFWYLQERIRFFESRLPYLTESNFDRRFYEAVIETPAHLMRKMLPVLGLELSCDTKQEVCRVYSGISTEEEYSLFTRCLKIEELYVKELENQLIDRDRPRYEHVIQLIELTAPFTLKFLKMIAHNVLGLDLEDPLYNPQFQ